MDAQPCKPLQSLRKVSDFLRSSPQFSACNCSLRLQLAISCSFTRLHVSSCRLAALR